ncbi:LOW QUALITY PROTEIN: Bardet-Biedl syndrome 1 protein homolog [Pollicipes pollicipes]|uniref:LOW QUALITY PROTEIN: Bardet-Biedl syndrome 1 protein homolog n=1 Tax=Pollicipes pollicipes TaxID=41117 RepID=UPI0018851F4A|nr:LOW QUALITY PROTEIN: Bardet-Biedl syndrome 1 protein homolog [Pollicipes pollicipes]
MTSKKTYLGSTTSLKQPEKSDKWLDALSDPLTSLYTFNSSIALSDLNGDGDAKLIVADLGTGMYQMKLKVFRGTSLMSENTLLDLPTAVVAFHMDTTEPRVPAIAVASGAYIYIYKNLRPYFKFTLPTLEVNPSEFDLWTQARDDMIDCATLYDTLEMLRKDVGAHCLTTRTQHLLMCRTQEQREAFVESHKYFMVKKRTVITCMTTMKKNMSDEQAVSCLVLGTESCQVYVLDPEAFTLLMNLHLPSVPAILTVTGLFDVEYRMLVACRNGKIYTAKRGMEDGRLTAELSSQPVGLERRDKTFLVGCMDDHIYCFSNHGKLLWRLRLGAGLLCMTTMDLASHGQKLLLVSLTSGEVRTYQDRQLVDSFQLDQPANALKFGRFGREENVLLIVNQGGGLQVKILRRRAKFEPQEPAGALPGARELKLNIPKKTKLFVDQTMRERENSQSMHRIFQYNLYLLRLDAARQYVQSLDMSLTPVTTDEQPIRLAAQVLGLGPMFKIRVELQNTSALKIVQELGIRVHADEKLYHVQQRFIHVPILIPGVTYVYDTLVEFVSDLGISDKVRVFVTRGQVTRPILSAVISMPVAEVAVAV